MDTELLIKLIGWGGALPAILIFVASKLFPIWLRGRSDAANVAADVAEAGARVGMLEQLQARLAKVEENQAVLNDLYDKERELRRAAEDKVATLTRRVGALERQIKSLGATPEQDF